MNAYKTLSRDLIEIKEKIYRVVRYFGDVWLVKEVNTIKFYIFDRNEEYFFLIPKESMNTMFVLSDLTNRAFVEVCEMPYKGHTFKLLRCKETKCLYIADLVPETKIVKHLTRVPSNKAEVLLDQRGNIVSVYHDKLDVIHIEKGKFVI